MIRFCGSCDHYKPTENKDADALGQCLNQDLEQHAGMRGLYMVFTSPDSHCDLWDGEETDANELWNDELCRRWHARQDDKLTGGR